MAVKKMKSYKGRVVRITRLDACGAPVYGACSVVVTEGFITVKIGNEYEKGGEYTQKNAWGELSMAEKDPDFAKWAKVGIDFCEVDPSILDIVGGANPVVVGSDTIGATFGKLGNESAFALELWTKKAGAACAGGTQEWGYLCVPYCKNGKLDGDLTVEAAPLNFSMTAEGNGVPDDWGTGPHGDNPFRATAGFPVDELFGVVVTTVAPPAATDGCVTLTLYPTRSAVLPSDAFLAEATITASDATNAGRLAGLGFIAAAPGAWTTGQSFTVGGFAFNWSGSAWAAGAHA